MRKVILYISMSLDGYIADTSKKLKNDENVEFIRVNISDFIKIYK